MRQRGQRSLAEEVLGGVVQGHLIPPLSMASIIYLDYTGHYSTVSYSYSIFLPACPEKKSLI
jgi:hypothetical protein